MITLISIALFYLFQTALSDGTCPGLNEGTPFKSSDMSVPSKSKYINALKSLNIKSVFKDIYKLLTDSQTCWPADQYYGKPNYGPLFIRLAWHCSGSFRATDNNGGCVGGRMRYLPESSWEDNTNLDKARALLAPIKKKYGDSLSWGDLIIFSGTASILYMGGPITEVCGGRIDDIDGSKSDILMNKKPCNNDGTDCDEPNGAINLGLIYVDAQGVNGIPIPENSVNQIRDIFSRMGMNDRETVALIGGGHAFGKCHGACPDGAGKSPKEDPKNPWPGKCGNGKGKDTYTSGFEGQWTDKPDEWDNEYFKELLYDNYKKIKGLGGKFQWKNERNGYMMLTADLALRHDKDYLDIIDEYAHDIESLEREFANAWEKLTTSGKGWVKEKYRKCVNGRELIRDMERNNDKKYKKDNALMNEVNRMKGMDGKLLNDAQIIMRMVFIAVLSSLGVFMIVGMMIVCCWKSKHN